MSEEKAKKPGKPAAAAGATAGTEGAAQYTQKKKKTPWTIERCKKFARRYSNLQQWESGSPSSFKAANAHGWINECKALFSKTDSSKKIKKSA